MDISTSPPSSPSTRDVAAPVTRGRAALLAYGNFVFRYRDYLAPAIIATIVLLTRPHPWGGDVQLDPFLDALGVIVALCGQTLRMLVIGLAYIQRGGKNKRIAADRLVTDGLFAHCRHPLYVGNFLLVLGLMLIWNSPWAYVAGLGIVGLSLFAMASAEEAFLRRKFGAEYDDYCRRVNRFIPEFSGLGQTLRGFQFDWKRVIRKEYGTTFSWTTTAIALVVLERVMWNGASASRSTLIGSAVVWLCLASTWGVVRSLKKSRRLA